MKPGRELDAFVAEKVMGWKVLSHWDADGTVKHLIDENQCEVIPPEFKHYSTDIAAAWEIVNHFKEFAMNKMYFPEPERIDYIVRFTKHAGAQGESIPHAICLAALKAVGVTI